LKCHEKEGEGEQKTRREENAPNPQESHNKKKVMKTRGSMWKGAPRKTRKRSGERPREGKNQGNPNRPAKPVGRSCSLGKKAKNKPKTAERKKTGFTP